MTTTNAVIAAAMAMMPMIGLTSFPSGPRGPISPGVPCSPCSPCGPCSPGGPGSPMVPISMKVSAELFPSRSVAWMVCVSGWSVGGIRRTQKPPDESASTVTYRLPSK
ncbi:MAG: hypothetical protein FJZ95_04555 [Chloroflexi bacterium]|nr:hypothetical protein [Chloroflexota bacterium]